MGMFLLLPGTDDLARNKFRPFPFQGTGDFTFLSLFRKKHIKIFKVQVEINCRVNKR